MAYSILWKVTQGRGLPMFWKHVWNMLGSFWVWQKDDFPFSDSLNSVKIHLPRKTMKRYRTLPLLLDRHARILWTIFWTAFVYTVHCLHVVFIPPFLTILTTESQVLTVSCQTPEGSYIITSKLIIKINKFFYLKFLNSLYWISIR